VVAMNAVVKGAVLFPWLSLSLSFSLSLSLWSDRGRQDEFRSVLSLRAAGADLQLIKPGEAWW
jgi:hypothetical protein